MTVAEMVSLEDLAREALAESRFSASAFSPEKFRKGAERAAADTKRHGVLIAANDNGPVGFLYCTIVKHLADLYFCI